MNRLLTIVLAGAILLAGCAAPGLSSSKADVRQLSAAPIYLTDQDRLWRHRQLRRGPAAAATGPGGRAGAHLSPFRRAGPFYGRQRRPKRHFKPI